MKRATCLLVLVASLAVAGSAPAGGISDEPCMNVAGEHTNTCPTGIVGVPYSLRFVEREGSGCGLGRQTFHFDSGELPPELTLAPDGTLSGTPTRAGTFQFYVEMREPQDDPAHCAGKRTQKQFTLKVCNQLGVFASPPIPPRAEVGVGFRMRLSSCAGVSALTWTHAVGALPGGVRLRADGSIAGMPTEAGTYRFAVDATDVRGNVGRYAGTISVARRLRLRTQHLAAATIGRAYRAKLVTVGGAPPKIWTISRGRLPRGIHLDRASGVIAGTARTGGAFRVVVAVRDELRVTSKKSLGLVVVSPARSDRRREATTNVR